MIEYEEKEGFIDRIEEGSVTVCIPPNESAACASCQNTALCSAHKKPTFYKVKHENPEGFQPRQPVILVRPTPPFAVSIFMVFILPLLLMILFPFLLYVSGIGRELELYTIGAGFAGVVTALLLGRIVDKRFSGKHPVRIKVTSDQ